MFILLLVQLINSMGQKVMGLYINSDIKINSLISGGGQERNLRAGTENVYGIAGLSKAMDISYKNLDYHRKHIEKLKS